MARLLSLAVILALTGFVSAQEKKAEQKKDDKKPDTPVLKGHWVKDADGFVLEMKFDKETYTTTAKAGDNSIVVTSKYTVDKDGKVKAEVTDVKETGSFPSKPEKGTKFTFTFKVDEKAKSAKMSDFDMPGAEGAKDVVEGEYKEKKAD